MWFAEQLDSFLNLGICKEYPNMARSKSTSGSKAKRTNTNTNETASQHQQPSQHTRCESGRGRNCPVEANSTRGQSRARTQEVAKIVKKRTRKNVTRISQNVVPINLEDEIRRRAYELYQQRGTASGSEAEDWLTAEREVRQRYHQQQALSPSSRALSVGRFGAARRPNFRCLPRARLYAVASQGRF